MTNGETADTIVFTELLFGRNHRMRRPNVVANLPTQELTQLLMKQDRVLSTDHSTPYPTQEEAEQKYAQYKEGHKRVNEILFHQKGDD